MYFYCNCMYIGILLGELHSKPYKLKCPNFAAFCKHIELNEVSKEAYSDCLYLLGLQTLYIYILHLDFQKPAEGRAPVPSLGICI